MAASPPYGMPPPQPPYGQPPPPARRRGRAGWIAAGVAAAVLVIAVAAAAVVVIVTRGESPVGWAPGAGEQSQSPAPGAGAPQPPEEPVLTGTYGARDGLCAAVDLIPLETLVPGAGIEEDSGFSLLAWHWVCGYDLGELAESEPGPDGYLDLYVDTHPDAEFAKESYDEDLDFVTGNFESYEEAGGPWDEGLILHEDRSDNVLSFVNVGYKVLHGNLEVEADLQFSRPQDGLDRVPDMEAALYEVVINAMEALALERVGPERSASPSRAALTAA